MVTSSVNELLSTIYDRMFSYFGPQHWWPADTPFEVCIGAILTQNTSWNNVTRAVSRLKDAGVMAPEPMYRLSREELAELIRPAGYYNIKAKRLHSFLDILVNRFQSDLDVLFSPGLEAARATLLSVKGIGPETADSMLLYAGQIPSFVVDAYTIRALARHDIVTDEADYHSVRDLFMDNLPHEVPLLNEFHALWVRVGKEFCKKGRPRCEECPLKGI